MGLKVILAAWLVAAVAGCQGQPVAAPDATPGGRRMAERIERLAGVANVARVDEGVYRGAQPEGDGGVRSLKALGIKTVINLRNWHDEKVEVEALGMKSVAIPIRADLRGSEPPTDEQIRLFLRTVQDPANRPVYFHCAYGEDRTGAMCAVYRMEVDGWSNADAYAEMEAFGFSHVWIDLRDFVQGYRPHVLAAPPAKTGP